MGNFRPSIKNGLIVILGLATFVFHTGCSKKNDKPPYTPTQAQDDALSRFEAEADAYRNSLLANPFDRSHDQSSYDRMMNTILSFITADGGQSANRPGAMDFLIWYITNYIQSNAAPFSGLPLAQQQAILNALYQGYQSSYSAADPRVQGYFGAAYNPFTDRNSNLIANTNTNNNTITAPGGYSSALSSQTVNLNNPQIGGDTIFFDPNAPTQ